ncbi:MAG: hydroxyacylglutathione hydrolase [Pseudomonadota bacterium]
MSGTYQTFHVHQFMCRSDNFGVLLHDPASGLTASIDAPDADVIQRALDEKGWQLSHILITHHHGDHTAGIPALKERHGCTVIGPADEANKIKGLDEQVTDGDTVTFAGTDAHVMSTPGHTLGHIVYWFSDLELLFAGDTLFAMGCGRLFEGSPKMMWASLMRLAALPEETTVYCGHEYTLANARFAVTVDPGNEALSARLSQVEQLRAETRPTLPTTIGQELATNPFMRAGEPGIRAALSMPDAADADVFAKVRALKDAA